jgi:hypothetical protein
MHCRAALLPHAPFQGQATGWTPVLMLAMTLLLTWPARADEAPPPPGPAADEPPSVLYWSLGFRLKADDLQTSSQLSLHPMIGLRYGRWRIGAVDGENWHRFGQLKTDSTLTYDWLNTDKVRTSLSGSIQNLQNDGSFSALEPGTKTLRGKATVDYIGWPRWSVGLVLMQDVLGRGAGTALSPSITYRQPLSEDSTLLLSQSLTWGNAALWATTHRLSPDAQVRQDAGWGSLDGSVTLRQRWKPRWSWYAQLNHSRALGTVYPDSVQDRGVWSTQAGVIYFDH